MLINTYLTEPCLTLLFIVIIVAIVSRDKERKGEREKEIISTILLLHYYWSEFPESF